ncbi:MAG: ABC transporter substrate-binding protein, partial [Actinomycetota bacterium]|nr:ABC transporter substrate-binding protein [Actinomycetota bacterium]
MAVYVSLPLSGPRQADGADAADGARLAWEQAGESAGELEVRAHFLDDAGGSRWDPVAVGRNARSAVQDASTAAYIGELESQPTRASLPITNRAGIAQISPGAGGVDLTRAVEGYPDSPDRYRPSGKASFARVIPDDAAQAAAAADWAAELGPGRAATVAEQSPFGELTVAEFENAAREVGVEIVEPGARAPL